MRSRRIRDNKICWNSFRSSDNNNFYLKHIIIIITRIDGNGRRASCVRIVLSPSSSHVRHRRLPRRALACVCLSVFMGLCARIIICRHSSGQRWLGWGSYNWWEGGVIRRRRYDNKKTHWSRFFLSVCSCSFHLPSVTPCRF